MRRLLILVIIAAIFAGGGYALYSSNQSRQAAAKPNIRQVTVDRGDLTLAVNATGAVAALRTARLSFDNPGLVTEIYVREGQRVLSNQLLAKQDDTAYQLGVKQAEAALRAAQLQLEQLQSPPTDRDLAVAQANVKAAKDSYQALLGTVDPNAVNAAQLKYQQAQTAYQDAIQRRKDAGGRYKQDSPEYQLALAQEGQSSFGVEAARLQLELLRRGPDSRILSAAKERITLAEAELARLKAGPQQIQLDQAALRVKQAQAALDQAKDLLRTTELRAPFGGEISTLLLKVGGLSVSSAAGIVIVDRSQLNVNINVDEVDIGQIREGQAVTLTLDALPDDAFTGTVARIAPAANSATGAVVTYQVQVQLPPSATRIKPGMTASASIVVRTVKDVLRVPNIFVRIDKRNNQAYVNLVGANGKLTEIPVILGLRADEYSEVVSGLNEGDAIGVSLDSGLKLLGN